MPDGSQRKAAIAVLALVAAATISASGLLSRTATGLGAESLATPPKAYLDRSTEQSVRFLVVLSAAKTALAVVEGSSANVSFVFFGASLQVGDVVKALYDAVDYAWTAVLFGCAVLFALNYLLEGGFHLGQYTLTLMLLCFATNIALQRWPFARDLSGRLSRFFLSVTLAVWLAFPMALVLASITSTTITAPPLENAQREVSSFQESVVPPNDSGFRVHDAIERTRTYLVTKTDDITRALGTIIASYVLDCVVFPAAFFILLVGFSKRIAGLP